MIWNGISERVLEADSKVTFKWKLICIQDRKIDFLPPKSQHRHDGANSFFLCCIILPLDILGTLGKVSKTTSLTCNKPIAKQSGYRHLGSTSGTSQNLSQNARTQNILYPYHAPSWIERKIRMNLFICNITQHFL